MIIDLPPTGLYDVHIFSSNRLSNFNSSFSNRKFGEKGVAWRYPENLTD